MDLQGHMRIPVGEPAQLSPWSAQEQVQRLQRAAEASTSTQGEGESLPPGWAPYAAFPGPGLVRWPASLEHWRDSLSSCGQNLCSLVQVVENAQGGSPAVTYINSIRPEAEKCAFLSTLGAYCLQVVQAATQQC